MQALPGEVVVRTTLTKYQSLDHLIPAEAIIRAALNLSCHALLPLESWRADKLQFAVVVASAYPAVMEVALKVSGGDTELVLRLPATAEAEGRALLEQVAQRACELSPHAVSATQTVAAPF